MSSPVTPSRIWAASGAFARARMSGLLTVVYVVVMFFALTYYLLERADPEQFSGLETRTDALYFTLSTMATVGYGDVHAEGQLARGLASALIVFNVVVVASLAREHFGRGVGGPP